MSHGVIRILCFTVVAEAAAVEEVDVAEAAVVEAEEVDLELEDGE